MSVVKVMCVVLSVVLCGIVSVTLAGDAGPCNLDMIAVNKCGEDNHKFKFNLNVMNINETHDCFSGDIILGEQFTEENGVRIELCEKKNNQWKKIQVLANDSFYNISKDVADEHLKAFLAKANMKEPPVPKGTYHIDKYSICKQPEGDYMPGSFKLKIFVLEEDDEVGCVEYEFDLTKRDDE